MLTAAKAGELAAFVLGGVRVDDLPTGAAAALQAADCVVVLDTHDHDLVQLADIVFPVAAAAESSGTYVNWEGRDRRSAQVLRTPLLSDARVLSSLASELDVTTITADRDELRAELAEFTGWTGARVDTPTTEAEPAAAEGLRLATWRPLLEATVLQEGEPYLAATARPQEVWLSHAEASSRGLDEGQMVTVTSGSGSVTAPLMITAVAEGAVVVTGDAYRNLCADGVTSGDPVQVAAGGQA
jgi:NADH-quinone oxidoreductase subunit G